MHAGYGIELRRTKVLHRHPRTGSWSVALGLQIAELRWERSCCRQVASCCTAKAFPPSSALVPLSLHLRRGRAADKRLTELGRGEDQVSWQA